MVPIPKPSGSFVGRSFKEWTTKSTLNQVRGIVLLKKNSGIVANSVLVGWSLITREKYWKWSTIETVHSMIKILFLWWKYTCDAMKGSLCTKFAKKKNPGEHVSRRGASTQHFRVYVFVECQTLRAKGGGLRVKGRF